MILKDYVDRLFFLCYKCASIFIIGVISVGMEILLRVQGHFYSLRQLKTIDENSNTENIPQEEYLVPPWVLDTIKSIFSCSLRLFTYIIMFIMMSNLQLTNLKVFILTASLIIVPRIYLASCFLSSKRNFSRTKPNQTYGTKHLSTIAFNGIVKIFQSMNETESLIIGFCQYLQSIILLVLGYDFRLKRMKIYFLSESILVCVTNFLVNTGFFNNVIILVLLTMTYVDYNQALQKIFEVLRVV